MKEKISNYRLLWTLKVWKDDFKAIRTERCRWPFGFEEVYREIRKIIKNRNQK
jgi:hypothetical protein